MTDADKRLTYLEALAEKANADRVKIGQLEALAAIFTQHIAKLQNAILEQNKTIIVLHKRILNLEVKQISHDGEAKH